MRCKRLASSLAALQIIAIGLHASQAMKEPTDNDKRSAYLIEAKLTITQKDSDVTQEIFFTSKLDINQETAGTIKSVKEMPITDLPEQPNIGLHLHALIKNKGGLPCLSMKITNISLLGKTRPIPEETAWLHTQSTESWIYAKLDHLPRIIKLPPFESGGKIHTVELKVSTAD